ncbi:IPT/TIG domain-containing protein [Sphingobacterium spiritivorum]|uniref:IPT/TIG domain-containing protein n=1 Tax=Sphingobacterium spiritivorum TaxID=258 RepID=UPI003DA27A37
MKSNVIYLLAAFLLLVSCSKDSETKAPLEAPLVYSISPQIGRPGTVITIEGENFSRLRVDNKISFNGVKAEIIHFNERTIHVRAPEGSSDGPVTVNVAGRSVEGPSFQFIQPPKPTGETIVVKVLSMGIQPFAATSANRTESIMEYLAGIAKSRDVDFMIAREVDSVTNRSKQVDRPLRLAELSGLKHYMFSRAILAGYQGGQFGLSVYSKHPIVEERSVSLNNNRTVGFMKVQITPKSQMVIAGVQLEDVVNSQALREAQANLLISTLNDIMVPTVLAGGIFMLDQQPEKDPTFQLLSKAGYVPGCTACEWTFPASATVNSIADFISYRWSREARVIKYETLDVAPAPGSGNRRPVYAEIEFKL